MHQVRLGVNIDHVATLRQARRATEPDPVHAAVLAEMAGADGITIHLRQDRRHIQERDLEILRKTIKTKLNLEMAVSMEMVKIALANKPDICTLVPETSEEISTNGGLDVPIMYDKLEEVAGNLRAAGIDVSLFIDPTSDIIKACHRIGIRTVEFNTAAYAENWGNSYAQLELEKLQKAAVFARKLSIRVLAGHGLNYHNVRPLVAIPEVEELNIGHAIVGQSIFTGMKEAVERMIKLLQR